MTEDSVKTVKDEYHLLDLPEMQPFSDENCMTNKYVTNEQKRKNLDTDFREKMKSKVNGICRNHGAFEETDSSESEGDISSL